MTVYVVLSDNEIIMAFQDETDAQAEVALAPSVRRYDEVFAWPSREEMLEEMK